MRPAPHPSSTGSRYRLGSLVGGGLLTAAGLRTPATIGVPLTIAGAALLYRASQKAGISTRPRRAAGPAPVDVSTSVTVRCGADVLYAYWRDFTHLPRFMRSLQVAEPVAAGRYRFEARLPGMDAVSWTADVVEDRASECIRWSTPPESELMHQGMVTFLPAPGGRGTEVHLNVAYRLRSAAATVLARWLATVDAQVIKEELRRFKQCMETGELPTTEGQPSG